MKYRLLVTDIDDTLLTTDKRITDKVKEAIIKAQDSGVKVAIASGRLPIGVRPYAEELGICERGGCYLAFNGGLVLDAEGSILHSNVLDRKYLPAIYNALRSYDVTVLVHTHDKIFTDNNQNSYAYTEPEALHQPLYLLDNLLTDVDWDLHKILIAGEPELLKEVEPVLNARFGDELDIFLSAPWFLDVMPKGVNKGVGVKYLAERLDIPMEQVIEEKNGKRKVVERKLLPCYVFIKMIYTNQSWYYDLSMIKMAGLGVAMHNAEDALKDAADYITAHDCDHDGIAEVVEKFILSDD